MILWDDKTRQYKMLNNVNISDGPVFTHRGISLDTVRNYISVDKIKQVRDSFWGESLSIWMFQVIDSLSYSKMNVFHWHISDTQSFPLELPSLPNFSYYGAYSPEEIYTAKDVSELVAYADDRGVRIIPELDAPAHVGNV